MGNSAGAVLTVGPNFPIDAGDWARSRVPLCLEHVHSARTDSVSPFLASPGAHPQLL